MIKSIVNNANKYRDKWVAMPSFNNRNVVASGIDPEAVIKRAKKKGHTSPVVIYVPAKNVRYIL